MTSGVSFSADDIRRILRLEPLPQEGGFFRETYRSVERVRSAAGDERAASTAIYYLLSPGTFSALHRLPGDEVFHFYLGDTIEMFQLHPGGSSETVLIGSDLAEGAHPQVVVSGGVWQGCRLCEGGRFALLGTTMSPGFDRRDFELGDRATLIAAFPADRERIIEFTHA